MSRSRDVANLVGSLSIISDGAPEALDTLNELAAALNDDPNFATTISTAIENSGGYARTFLFSGM